MSEPTLEELRKTVADAAIGVLRVYREYVQSNPDVPENDLAMQLALETASLKDTPYMRAMEVFVAATVELSRLEEEQKKGGVI